MKSNYPRSSDEVPSPAKPRIWLYSVGLGLVVYLVGHMYALTEGSSRFLGIALPRLDSDILFTPILLVLAWGVILVWKSGRWRFIDKSKLIALTTTLLHLIAFSLFVYQAGPPRTGILEQYGLFWVVTIYFAALLSAACSVIWGLEAVVTRIRGKRLGEQTTVIELGEQDKWSVGRRSEQTDDVVVTVKS